MFDDATILNKKYMLSPVMKWIKNRYKFLSNL